MSDKPLGAQKAYGHIGHLPGSRMGSGDHMLNVGQARIATQKTRDRHDRVWVQEKLDGSCVAVAKVAGELIPLQRAGYRALSSPFEQHHLFHAYVMDRWATFDGLLADGERVVGEWLAMAHGTRYDLTGREPFVAFDLMTGPDRLPLDAFMDRVGNVLTVPTLMSNVPTTIEDAMVALGRFGFYGATDPAEGIVWRVERHNRVDFLAKYVRPDKVDGSYFEGGPVWNWQPSNLFTAALR